jgi:hypothetical protein
MWTLLNHHPLLGVIIAHFMLPALLFHSPSASLAVNDTITSLARKPIIFPDDPGFSDLDCGAQHSCVEREKKCALMLKQR